jgi:hypothetical protein
MKVWRLNIKTDARVGFDPREYCIANNLVGIGWPVAHEDHSPPRDLEDYLVLGRTTYADNGDNGWWPAVNALGNRITQGDLCWTRDHGVYYLGRVTGSWTYLDGEQADNFDVHCVRPCLWHRVGLLDAVPGAVERSFIPSRTLQAIDDETAQSYSRYIYGQLTGESASEVTTSPDIFGLLSPLDHEDLAALYLQTEGGYVIVPSTVKSSTAAYEWVMIEQATGEKAVLQVKSGGASINLSELGQIPCRVFVVAADGVSVGEAPINVTRIPRDELLAFARRRRELMPERIRRYLAWAAI